MKTLEITTVQYLSITVLMLAGGLVSFNAHATENTSLAKDTQVIFHSQAANHNIHGYQSSVLGEEAVKPELVYVSQSNGPAIYSYKHSGSEIAVPWNVEYVDTAYGPAIYSYESHLIKKTVEVLPLAVR